MIALARRLLLVSLLIAWPAGPEARAAPYEVAVDEAGGIAVEVPAPAGYDAVAAVQPFAAVARATLPAGAEMLAAFVPHGFFETHPADARPDTFLVATWRTALAGRRLAPDIMAEAKAATERELAPYLQAGGPPVPLGVYADFRIRTLEAEGPRSVSWIGVGTVPPGGENGAGWREAYGGAVVYANGTLVNLVIRAAKLDAAGFDDAQRTLRDWTAAVEAANPDAPAAGFFDGPVAKAAAGAAAVAVALLAAGLLRRRRHARPGAHPGARR